ncbi:hypothetical protein ABZY03_29215 [Streptomyces klenkii]
MLDSQSVKGSERSSWRGHDSGKKVYGVMYRLMVDAPGWFCCVCEPVERG